MLKIAELLSEKKGMTDDEKKAIGLTAKGRQLFSL